MMMKDDVELCKWLRDNSSGIYRPSALAANRIEELLVLVSKLDDIFIALEKLKNDDEEGVYWGRDQDIYNIAIDDVIHFIRGEYSRGFFNNSEKNDD
tara:strand:+ start:4128 stop:4418 length:291 start_codon:yes stop_codon:yes gene_type:complete